MLTIFKKAINGNIVIDTDGTILLTNPTAENIFGRTKDELIGELLGFPITHGKKTELEIVNKTGKTTNVEMSVVETQWDNKNAFRT